MAREEKVAVVVVVKDPLEERQVKEKERRKVNEIKKPHAKRKFTKKVCK